MAVKPAIAQFAGGEGTEGEPWQVATLDQLQKVGEPEYLDKHFILANDIDASETADWHDGKGFVPIGSDVVPFTGFFNGNGFNIENLSIQRETEDFIGLFGITGHESEIINVALEDVNIAGKSHVGGLIGKNLGLVADCSISGTVTGTANRIGGLAGENSGEWLLIENFGLNGEILRSYSNVIVNGIEEVGGLVGRNMGHISHSHSSGHVSGGLLTGGFAGTNYTDRFFAGLKGKIAFSSSSVEVIGNSGVGGLAGRNDGDILYSNASGNVFGQECIGGLIGATSVLDNHDIYPKVLYSFSMGDVTGVSSVGGLVGCQLAKIKDCYATGTVSGEKDIGGLVGTARGEITGKMNQYEASYINHGSIGIYTSYSTGPVNGVENVGGLSGLNEWPVFGSYWAIDTSGYNVGTGVGTSDGITGLNTSQMTGQNAWIFMHMLDFDEVWQLTEGYPVLAWQEPDDAVDKPKVSIIILEPSKEQVNFGEVETDTTETRSFTISNTGNEAMSGVVSLSETHGGVFEIIQGEGDYTLEPGSSRVVEVAFCPASEDSYQTTLEIHHDAPNRDDPLEVALNGKGKQPTFVDEQTQLPRKPELRQNYPNPFNPVTVIPFSVPERAHVRLEVYDILGRQVSVLADRTFETGRHETSWDGSQAASGIYIIRMVVQTDEGQQKQFNQQITLMK